ncbi:kelch domain-containing protein 3-like [Mya arenaria]|uniref:kelch domain-containing protein 3-like n=1 Tax=Mya arenaria TaxID=6604 RepID=UPI0022E3D557|nr:kelch domain-containing protein 3-like [Mya arenaria]XP_052767383.1 kelch domain-containing protein 3-like [Mya arenaria]XP_052767384.1 kelch domain-containing protein 3-like [Mya arenaria]XP_052767385.1 kelch domain-containing protein 3-like [Mya arenaria]
MLRWTVHLEGGPRRVNHAAVVIGEKIYSFGGYCTGEDYESRLPIDIHVLDTISLRWHLLPTPDKFEMNVSVPYQRYGHTAVSHQDSAYIWGGRNDSDGACNILFMFNTLSSSWSRVEVNGDIPGARDGHSACIINDKMYIFGGYEEQIDRFSDDIYSFEFATSTWTHIRTKGRPARWRDFHTAVGVGDVMYVFGGRSDQGGDMFTNMELYCNTMHTFDTVAYKWHQPFTHGIIPMGRRSHSVFSHENCVYIFGGYNGNHDLHFKDLFKYDTISKRWSLVEVRGEGPCARRRQCCCKVGTRVYMFGGTSPNTTISASGEEDVMLTDLSDLHVLDLSPSLKTLTQLAVIQFRLDTSCLPRDIRWELSAMTTPNVITRSLNSNG